MVTNTTLVPDVRDENEYRRIVRERLNALFGPRKNPQESHFINEVLKRGEIGLLTITLFIMVCYVMFAFASAESLIRYPQYILQRCEITELENHFNDKQIAAISSGESYMNFPRSHCYYQKRNYTELMITSNYSFAQIMTEIEKRGPASKKLCKRNIFYYMEDVETPKIVRHSSSYYTYYDLHCSTNNLQAFVQIMPFLGYIFCSMPMGILADLYGRRLLSFIASAIFLLNVLILLSPYKVTYMIAKFFLGIGICTEMLLLILFLEQCSIKTRNYLGFIAFGARPIGRFFVRGLVYRTRIYYLRVAVLFGIILPLLFIVWFMQESPRWQYFRGKKRQAWEGISEPEAYPPNLNQLPTKLERVNLLQHMRLFTKVLYRLRTFRHLFLMFSETILGFYHVIGRNELYYYMRWNYFIRLNLTVLVSTFVLHFALIFLARKTVLLATHTVLVLCCAVNLLQTSESGFVVFCDITQRSLAEVCLIFVLYQSLELFPTPQRATIVGMSLSVIGLSTFIAFNIDYIFGDERKTLLRAIGLTLVIICTALAAFIPETYNNDLPDLPREALSSRFINVF